MTTPANRINGEQLLVQIESAPGSNVFVHDCLINAARGIQFTAQLVSTVDPLCDDPSAPAWNATEKDGLGCTINGAGKLELASVEMWDAWFRSSDTKTVRVRINKTGGRTWQGAFHCHDFQVSGDRKARAEATVGLTADGVVALITE